MAPEPTPRTYLVGEELVTVPDDRCTKCLGAWQVNLLEPVPCPDCGAELGKALNVVVVGDVWPFCEERLAVETGGTCDCGFDWRAGYAVRH
jgi:hypothetical protein